MKYLSYPGQILLVSECGRTVCVGIEIVISLQHSPPVVADNNTIYTHAKATM